MWYNLLMVIQQYQDPKVEKYLGYGYWYQAHRAQVQKAMRLALIIVGIVGWSLALYNGYVFYLSSRNYPGLITDLVQERIPIEALHQSRAPQPLSLGPAVAVSGRDATTADFLARAANPNPDWYFEVDYTFNWEGGQTLPQSGFILPGGATAFTTRGVTVNSLPASATLDFTITQSKRIKDQALLARIKTITEGLIISAAQAARGGEDGVTQASYVVSNQTIYDFISPRWLVIVAQLGTPLAVGMNEAPELKSGETITLELRFLQSLPSGLAVEVLPLINALDQGAYRLPPGTVTPF